MASRDTLSPLEGAIAKGVLPSYFAESRTFGVECGHVGPRVLFTAGCSKCGDSNVRLVARPYARTVPTTLLEALGAFGMARMLACEAMLTEALLRSPERGRWVPTRFAWAAQQRWDRNGYPLRLHRTRMPFLPVLKVDQEAHSAWLTECLGPAKAQLRDLGVRIVRTTPVYVVFNVEPPTAPKNWLTDEEVYGGEIDVRP